MLRWAVAFILLVAACGTGSGTAETPVPAATDSDAGGEASTTAAPDPAASLSSVAVGRPDAEGAVDIATTAGPTSGNRVFAGAADLSGPPLELALPAPAIWVVGAETADGVVWTVALADGALMAFHEDEGVLAAADMELPELPAGTPFVLTTDGVGAEVIAPPPAASPLTTPLPVGEDLAWMTIEGSLSIGDRVVPDLVTLGDSRIVASSEGMLAVLADPTGRFAHGVLGDLVESESIAVIDPATATVTAVLDAPDDTVFEAISPMWTDVDGDGIEEVVATASDGLSGARLVVYDRDGTQVAGSPAIGTSNRWLNQLGVAPLGVNGEVEVVEIRTPHIGGIVRWSRLDGPELVLHASTSDFSTHRIGSRNLDQGIVVDADGDGKLDVLVPTQRQDALVAHTRTADASEIVAQTQLGSRLSSNLAAVPRSDGSVSIAAATEAGTLLIWP